MVRTLAGKAPLTVTVDKVGTTTHLATVYVDEPVEAAAEKMRKYGIRHVVVVNREGKLYGVISIRDLLKAGTLPREAIT